MDLLLCRAGPVDDPVGAGEVVLAALRLERRHLHRRLRGGRVVVLEERVAVLLAAEREAGVVDRGAELDRTAARVRSGGGRGGEDEGERDR